MVGADKGSMSRISPTHEKPVTDRPVTDRLALIALMLGAFSFLSAGLTSLGAIVVGVVALVRIRRGLAAGRLLAWLGVVFGFVTLIIVLVVGAVLLQQANQRQEVRTQTQQTQRQVDTARQSVIEDVRETTANVKVYLVKNPNATLDEIIKGVTVVNSDPAAGETIVIGSASGSNATAYKAWTVFGTDPALNVNSNYNYQSYTNTFRWTNNKTQRSTDVTEDKSPRNKGALGR